MHKCHRPSLALSLTRLRPDLDMDPSPVCARARLGPLPTRASRLVLARSQRRLGHICGQSHSGPGLFGTRPIWCGAHLGPTCLGPGLFGFGPVRVHTEAFGPRPVSILETIPENRCIDDTFRKLTEAALASDKKSLPYLQGRHPCYSEPRCMSQQQ